jgi:hypothetical protein
MSFLAFSEGNRATGDDFRGASAAMHQPNFVWDRCPLSKLRARGCLGNSKAGTNLLVEIDNHRGSIGVAEREDEPAGASATPDRDELEGVRINRVIVAQGSTRN